MIRYTLVLIQIQSRKCSFIVEDVLLCLHCDDQERIRGRSVFYPNINSGAVRGQILLYKEFFEV